MKGHVATGRGQQAASRWLPAPASGRERPVRAAASGALHHLPRETGGGNRKQGQQLRLRACFCHQPAPPRRPGPAALAAHACAPAQARDCCAAVGMCPGGASNDWLITREREGEGATHAACARGARGVHGSMSGGALKVMSLPNRHRRRHRHSTTRSCARRRQSEALAAADEASSCTRG